MRLFGLTITRQKHTAVDNRGAWWPIVRESFPGAWQKNIDIKLDNVLAHNAVYACVTLISSDIAKLRLKLVEQDGNGIWTETENPAHSPVLRKPNRYQTRIDFFQSWLVSKLVHGNTYVLKERDNRNVVVRLYVLDPVRTKPLVTPDGDVFYQLGADNLSGLPNGGVTVPASEIIHDKMTPLFHPLCGVSPIFATGLAAMQGLGIQKHSLKFFENGANPGGILTAPAAISPEVAERIKEHWQQNYTGNNVGRVAVLGDGLTYTPMHVNAVDAQLIEQLKLSAENVCMAFHVPPYMIGVGPMPTYNNIEALLSQYYAQALQVLIESIELLLDEGLELKKPLGTEFDLDDLLRMDTQTKTKAVADAIGAGFLAPNEGRAKFDLKPVRGGESPYLQQQNFSLEALAERDEDKPFSKPEPTEPEMPSAMPEPDDEMRAMLMRSELASALGMKSLPLH